MTEQECTVLACERGWWRYAGNKEELVREQLGLSPVRYYQLLNRLLDDPEALATDPLLVTGCAGSGRRAWMPGGFVAWVERQRSGRYTGIYRDSDGRRRSAGTWPHNARALREANAAEAEQRARPTPGDAG